MNLVGKYKNLVEQRVSGVPVEVGRDGGLGQRASPQDEAVEQPPQEKAPHPALMSFSSFSSCATFVAHVTFSSAHVAAHSTRVAQVTFSSCIFTRRLCIILKKKSSLTNLHISLSFFSFLTHVTSLVSAKKCQCFGKCPKCTQSAEKNLGTQTSVSAPAPKV